MLLDRFELLEEVGRGASGVVYRARERSSGRVVAVKLLRDDGGRTDGLPLRVRLRREASLLGRVKHPGVVNVLDAASERELPYLVTEFVNGVSLQQLLRDRGPLPPAEIVSLVVQAARALHAAHAQGVVHRDVKPANLLVSSDGTLKITDFGVAGETGIEAWEDIEADEYLWGTPAYLPPERLRGSPLDGRSDLYSLGVVLYLGLTGKHPFEERSVQELTRRILHDEPAPASSIRPGLPAELVAFLRRALMKNPAQRFADGDGFARALEEIAIPRTRETWRPAERRWGIADDALAQTRRVPRQRRISWQRVLGAAMAVATVSSLSWLAGVLRPAALVSTPEIASIRIASPLPPPMAIEFDPPAPPQVEVVARVENTPPETKPAEPAPSTRASARVRTANSTAPRERAALRAVPQTVTWVAPRVRPSPASNETLPKTAPLATSAESAPARVSEMPPPPTPPHPTVATAVVAPENQPPLEPLPVASFRTQRAEDRREPESVPQFGRAVVEIAHALGEGLMEVRVAGRRVALVRVSEGTPAIASFRVPPGDQRVSISLLSASEHVDVSQQWADNWPSGGFRARRWALVGPHPEWRLEQQP
jgi:serine/threonine-protein kinase